METTKKETKIKYWVTMTDKFMSGWGHATNKINKLVFECETLQEAFIVEQNAKNRTNQKNINICGKKPYYNKDHYFTQIKNKEIYPSWYEKDYFKNRYNS
jgi:hypothetical protein